MAIRFYLMPAVFNFFGTELRKDPKYLNLWSATDRQQWLDYDRDGTFLVAVDVSPTQHTAISSNADVASFPANLDNQIGAALPTVIAEAESRHIPLFGINAGSIYKQLLRRVFLCIRFGQRAESIRFELFPTPGRTRLFGDGITINSQFSDLSPEDRTVLFVTFNSFGFDRGDLTASSTLRTILISFAQQWKSNVKILGIDL